MSSGIDHITHQSLLVRRPHGWIGRGHLRHAAERARDDEARLAGGAAVAGGTVLGGVGTVGLGGEGVDSADLRGAGGGGGWKGCWLRCGWQWIGRNGRFGSRLDGRLRRRVRRRLGRRLRSGRRLRRRQRRRLRRSRLRLIARIIRNQITRAPARAQAHRSPRTHRPVLAIKHRIAVIPPANVQRRLRGIGGRLRQCRKAGGRGGRRDGREALIPGHGEAYSPLEGTASSGGAGGVDGAVFGGVVVVGSADEGGLRCCGFG